MADAVIARTPEALNVSGGNPSAAWEKWKLKFEIFLQATGASTKPDVVKVGLLLNHIGDKALEIYGNFVFQPERLDPDNANRRLPAESRDVYAVVVRKFNEFFNRRDPQLMLREQFWYHLGREGSQTFDAWLRTVKEK